MYDLINVGVLWTMVHMILEIQSGNEVDDEYLNEMNVASEILDRLCEIDVNRSGFYFDKKLQIKELIQNSRLQNK